MAGNQALKTFIIYARDDKAYKDQLLRHLRPLVSSGYLNVWHDGDIMPGEDWEKKIKTNLKTSQLVLVLVSVNCLNSDFIEGQELETAVSQLRDGHTRIVPIIISPCGWRFHKLFVGLQGLPEDMKPVSEWGNPDRAWTDVVESLAKIVEETRAEQAETAKRQYEAEEQQRLAALAAEQEAQQKAARAERERLEREQREREVAEQKRLAEIAASDLVAKKEVAKLAEEAEKQRLADVAAQKAEDLAAIARRAKEAEQLRREQEAERKRQRQVAKNGDSGNTSTLWIGFGTVVALMLVLMVWKPWKKSGETGKVQSQTEQSTGQSADQMAFEQAKQRGTVAAWQQFISQYPNSPKQQEAKNQLTGLQTRVAKLIKEARTFINLEEPNRAKPLLEEAQRLDPENAEVTEKLKSLKKPGKD